MSSGPQPPSRPTPFRALKRTEVEGLVFATHLAFARALTTQWSLECARNFVQALMDGELLEVFDLARTLIAAPTRREGLIAPRATQLQAAALATIVYVDSVCHFDSAFHRWSALMRAGVPYEVLHAAELIRRGERGEVAA